ncbi:hypothetical protein MIND_01283800 [Mycena indigotica]|uniref:F-box domain-containing protein n=1 Tax=Mycena indigotica TaxID=2126181 RepID=A0A8H6VRI9_9AGAR|nr:uncharacterized protein MIND_01283800 [Mycena indigotica]KAF7291392.1 hypothetical protein MIND_01283800 [Mycena indigotica]
MPTHRSTPPEVWLEVLKALPTASLASVAETSRAFAALARPLLFAHFEFTPYHFSVGRRPAEGVYHVRGGEELERATARLDTWTSGSVAPLVRSCSIRPWGPRESAVMVVVDGEQAAMQVSGLLTFFARISRFTKLKSLILDDVTLPRDALASVYRLLPALEALHVVCHFSRRPRAFDTAAAAAVGKLRSLTLHTEPWDTTSHAVFLPFFIPATLRELNLSCNLLAWSNIPTFPAVTRLKICPEFTVHREGISSPTFAALLPRFPALEDLTIVGISRENPAVADVVAGCRSVVGTVRRLSTRSSRAVEVFLTDASALRALSFLPGDHISKLCGLIEASRPPLVCFSLDLLTSEAPRLAPMWACLPALRLLKIFFRRVFTGEPDPPEAAEASKIAPAYLLSLTAPQALPRTLRALVLRWRFFTCSPTWPRKMTHADFDLPAVASAVAEANPALTAIGVDAASFALRWQRRATGWEPWVDECAFAAENAVAYEYIQRGVEGMRVDRGLAASN